MFDAQTAAPGLRPRADRERAFLKAVIAFADGSITIPVTVVQTSAIGAKIMIDEGAVLPEKFLFAIPRRNFEGTARLVWRRQGYAGVAFETHEAVNSDPTDALRRRIEDLEKENAALRAELGHANTRINRLTEGY